MTHSLDWWLERLEGVKPVGDGYTALCPGHDDSHNSLSIKQTGDGVVVHCFASCTYKDIISAVEGHSGPRVQLNPVKKRLSTKIGTVRSKTTSRDWWEEYTQIPAGEWQAWGVLFLHDSIAFTWVEVPTQKLRASGEKKFAWVPDGSPRPPLWPSIPETLPKSVWITEGESDCGTLRYIGIEAFALTKGVMSSVSIMPVWESLRDRGVEEIIFVSDLDEAGQGVLSDVSKQLSRLNLGGLTVDLKAVLQPLLGEKDLRDLWVRLKNPQEMYDLLNSNLRVMVEHAEVQRVSIEDFMQMKFTEKPWLIKDVLFKETVGMIVGSPKMGKSWLALDLGLSIASGRPFLGKFPIDMTGPVVYISKEDPDFSLQDRISKILCQKGIGGSVQMDNGKISIKFPPVPAFPFFIDLSRDFLFVPEKCDELLNWLFTLKAQYGGIAAVIFDPVLRMIEGIDEFKASDINQAIFQPSSQIIREIGTSIFLVHHRTKGGGITKSSYGSIAFHAFSDSTMYLIGEEPDPEGWVPVHSEFKSAREFDWAFRLKDLETDYHVDLSMAGESRLLSPIAEDLRDILLDEGELSAFDLHKKTGGDLAMNHITQYLRQLESRGLVRRRVDRSGKVPQDVWSAVSEESHDEVDGK